MGSLILFACAAAAFAPARALGAELADLPATVLNLHRMDICLPAPGPPVRAFVENFDSGNLSAWPAWTQEFARTSSGIFVTSPVRAGLRAFKFTVAPGDLVNRGNRSELLRENSDPICTEAYYGWSFQIPPDYAESERWQIIAQWQSQPDRSNGETWDNVRGRSPMISLQYQIVDGTQSLAIAKAGWGESHRVVALGTIPKGQWIRIVFHIRWSLKNDGFVESWVNDQPFTPYNGVNRKVYGPTLYNALPAIFKFGLYRDPLITTTNSVYVDEIGIGNSYAEVNP
jgi:Polysaccharide lyase